MSPKGEDSRGRQLWGVAHFEYVLSAVPSVSQKCSELHNPHDSLESILFTSCPFKESRARKVKRLVHDVHSEKQEFEARSLRL